MADEASATDDDRGVAGGDELQLISNEPNIEANIEKASGDTQRLCCMPVDTAAIATWTYCVVCTLIVASGDTTVCTGPTTQHNRQYS